MGMIGNKAIKYAYLLNLMNEAFEKNTVNFLALKVIEADAGNEDNKKRTIAVLLTRTFPEQCQYNW